ncbi:hypothetical protein IAQ61_000481 [Plenodomus lingam]|uniref:Uncharacterized protein n=1 Tax=Leptosphaeria maculans (strain JN3 / isolate v23.1.3 / race Av1-4-5-6-7-8) TaxID=985895 RepID=E5A723_LEPMJ|nr:predicted protein [Plenodomus lingam JN3]KAH9881753.1 hypothetical protein IAQ61_000481 [Plenodomus lingam]CBX99418.1 predicted protein [Plenodomus lingam JN3]
MPNAIFFTACLLAICLPILSVQVPRTTLYTRYVRSRHILEPRSPERENSATTATTSRTKTDTDTEINTTITESKSKQHVPDQHRDKYRAYIKYQTSNSTSISPPEFLRRGPSSTPHIYASVPTQTPSQSLDGTHTGAASAGREEGDVSPSRKKPWDPPFPRRESVKVGSWRVLPPAPVTQGQRESGDMSVQEDDGVDGKFDTETADEDTRMLKASSADDKGVGQMRGLGPDHAANQAKKAKSKTKAMTVVWTTAAVMAMILFLLAFAVLVAHCLAWFLVYKTEARLGEARRGIMTRGDMRLCLCAA